MNNSKHENNAVNIEKDSLHHVFTEEKPKARKSLALNNNLEGSESRNVKDMKRLFKLGSPNFNKTYTILPS